MPGHMLMSSLAAALLAIAQPGAAATPTIQVYGVGEPVPPGLSSFFRPGDYPPEALAAHAEGQVRIHIVTGPDGSVSDCTVIASSGHAQLDQATCAIARARFRFVPAFDELGVPAGRTQDLIVDWRLPAA
jgi:protein TonB